MATKRASNEPLKARVTPTLRNLRAVAEQDDVPPHAVPVLVDLELDLDARVLAARSQPSALEGALSDREREVLAMVARGLPNKLIARELGISEKTVEAYLTRVFRAIGVSDRTQAALWAERNGLTRTGS